MEYIISKYITFSQKYNPFELALIEPNQYSELPSEKLAAILFGMNPIRIKIKDEWYEVLSMSEAVRSPSQIDGNYHFLYIQINWESNEYYIGKVNRNRWSEIKRYQGSGLKFRKKYNVHKSSFSRYIIACCETNKETEELEAKIVDEVLLNDPNCLNLVAGGGGTNEHNDASLKREKHREYMKSHPEQYEAMVEMAKLLYHSSDSYALEQRNKAIKATMSSDYYRQLSRDRILKWKKEHPDEYEKAREKNREAIRSPETQKKRKAARGKWIATHPDEYAEYQRKLIEARTTPAANEKRCRSIKAWNEAHPEEAKANARKRAVAAAQKRMRRVNMCDLDTGQVIRTFESQLEAARWLVDQGIAKNTNCKSSISQVCLRKPCTTGYGFRKKAYGFSWSFADESKEETQ